MMHYGSLLNKIHKYVHIHMSGGVTVEKLMFVEEAVERLMVYEDISLFFILFSSIQSIQSQI